MRVSRVTRRWRAALSGRKLAPSPTRREVARIPLKVIGRPRELAAAASSEWKAWRNAHPELAERLAPFEEEKWIGAPGTPVWGRAEEERGARSSATKMVRLGIAMNL